MASEEQAMNGLGLTYKIGNKFAQLMAERLLQERLGMVFLKGLILGPSCFFCI